MNIEPGVELTGIERAHLSVWLSDPSFKIVQKLLEDEVKKFNISLINATTPEEVVVRHSYAKVAAQIYLGLINRIQTEVEFYTKSPKPSDKPVDPTEESLDLGDLAEAMADVPNLMEIEP
jgi:hypothetical protein